jgi:hypothetical protein
MRTGIRIAAHQIVVLGSGLAAINLDFDCAMLWRDGRLTLCNAFVWQQFGSSPQQLKSSSRWCVYFVFLSVGRKFRNSTKYRRCRGRRFKTLFRL